MLLPPPGPPGEPAGLEADLRGNDVMLMWSPGATHGATIVSYVIEFMSNFRTEWRVKIKDLRVSNSIMEENPDKR